MKRVVSCLLLAISALWAHKLWGAPALDCSKAKIAKLEDAEAQRHRPSTATELATCYESTGELVEALAIFDALRKEGPKRWWNFADLKARKAARQRFLTLDKRVPRLTIRVTPDDAVVEVNGQTVTTQSPLPQDPKKELLIEVRAPGFRSDQQTIVLVERDTKELIFFLARAKGKGTDKGKSKPDSKGDDKGKDEPDSKGEDEGSQARKEKKRPTTLGGLHHSLGARFRGHLVPQFVMNWVGDGGTTFVSPGGQLTYTAELPDVEFVAGLGVASYGLGPTPFKPHGTPDTEWESIESDLLGLNLSLDVLFRIPLVEDQLIFKIGGGIGGGWAFAGDLLRTQTYPEGGVPGDPETYRPCRGPNNPPGTFRYCNKLRKDKDRFGSPDKTWFEGGARPVLYPWAALPEVALTWLPTGSVAVDVDLGLTLHGFMAGAGGRMRW